jgi:ABC-2 type transport system permease protein
VKTIAGIGTMIRLILRRDRIRIPLWILAISGIILSSAAGVSEVYATQEELDAYASSVGSNPAVIAMNGPPYALDTIGGVVVYETVLIAIIGGALMSLLLVTRHTRAEEETGRAELVQAAVVGKHAGLAAALTVVAGANLVLGIILIAGLISLDLPVEGAVAYGLATVGLGLVFVALAGVTSQITEYGRASAALAAAIFGIAYVIRAAGDVGSGFLSWFSPVGWAQAIQAFGEERWWTLALLFGLAGILTAAAFRLESRRDLGAGLIPARPGPPNASESLGRPIGLAARLQRAAMTGWAAGIFLLGIIYGSMTSSVETLVESNPELLDVLAQQDASLVDSFLSTGVLTISLIVGACVIQSMLRLRAEETAGRVESILGTATSRLSWATSHTWIALLGSAVIVALGGLGTGIAYGLSIGDWEQVPRLIGATIATVPAVWLLGALALALFGVAPRAVAVAWAFLAFCFVGGMLGRALDLPEWVSDISPFEHIPALPADELTIAPLLVVGAVAAALVGVGLASFRRRDLSLS